MSKLVVVKMTKHYGNNLIGDVCSFPEHIAAHVLENKGAEKLAEVEQGVERYDLTLKKVVPLKPQAAKV